MRLIEEGEAGSTTRCKSQRPPVGTAVDIKEKGQQKCNVSGGFADQIYDLAL